MIRNPLAISLDFLDNFQVLLSDQAAEELQNFDFKNLWQRLGRSTVVSAGLAAVDKDHLQGLKDKAEILQTMPKLSSSPPPLSPEEEQRKLEEEKKFLYPA